ncbi:PIN-like domain-containing protein [Haemophilus pittmaniae]|uniref:PIN-like domain-containing protein n=1 Tax=Haemophilus pittmaniae TaxID=249188 RepID=UPI0015F11121
MRERLNDLFCDKVGLEPKQSEIDSIEKEGEERYKNKIPPGFKDEEKYESFFVMVM